MTLAQAAGRPAPGVQPDGLGPNPTPPPIPTECGSVLLGGRIVYDRYRECTVQQHTLTVIRVPDGTVMGVGTVQVVHVITLDARVRQWTDDVYLNMYQASGVMVSGARIFPYFGWTPSSSPSPPTRCAVTARGSSAVPPSTTAVRSRTSRRPRFSDSAIVEHVQHIYDAQRSLPDHWGWRDHGPPLNRLYDAALRKRNRDVACAGFVPEPGDQCDEYPFQSSYEGASFVGRNRVSVRSIIASHNTTGGSRLAAFYRDQRVIDNDAFWVEPVP